MSTTTTQTESLLIDGARVEASDGKTFDVFDPSTGERLAIVAKATKADVDRAVKSAQAAMDSKAWGGLAPAERGRIMWRIAGAIRERAEELATLESRDNGKPLRQARTDVQVAARYFEFFAGIADKIMGNTIPLGPGFLDYTVREPIGVSAQIVPWNYPIQIGARGVAPALAAGCAVVLKPSSEAPMTALRLGEIGLACGLPPGALNVVPGTGSEAGTALASHPGINQLTFTGSVDVGVQVAKMAAENVVPVVMELGGKSPNIVFADADFELAAAGVSNAIFQNAGQTCSAGSRLLVERRAHDAFVDRLAARSKAMKVGPGVSDPDMGPIISKRQLETIEKYVAIGKQEGATVAAGGGRPSVPGLPRRLLLRADAARFGQAGHARRAGRDLRSGAGDHRLRRHRGSGDASQSQRLRTRRRHLDARHQQGDDAGVADQVGAGLHQHLRRGGGVELPFGGYKKSGYGREKGLESLASYTQVKNVCIKFS